MPDKTEVPSKIAIRPKKAKMTAKEVLTAVRAHYKLDGDVHGLAPEWAGIPEFSLRPGGGARRIDLFLVRAWSGKPKGHERISIEIKVSRADLKKELNNPHKIAPFAQISNYVYFATPVGLIKDDDPLPDGFGILEVSERGLVTVRKRARRNNAPGPIDEKTFVEAFRRAGKLDSLAWSEDEKDAQAQVVQLKQAVAALQSKIARLEDARTVFNAKKYERDTLLTALIADGLNCPGCGEPLRERRVGRNLIVVHANPADTRKPCYRFAE